MIYVYAITDPISIDGERSGLQHAPLETIAEAGVGAVYSSHADIDWNPDPALLWEHERVVEQLMEQAGVLPLRFGTVLSDPGALRSVLHEDGARFRILLSRVRGCVELSVRVGLAPSPHEQAADGAEYMRQRLAAAQQEEDAADKVLAPLRPLARATVRRTLRLGSTAVGESYLVPRAAVERFVAEVKALQAQNPTLAVSCTGPWGPYSFVDGGSK